MNELDLKLQALREATQSLTPSAEASARLRQAIAFEAGSPGDGPDLSKGLPGQQARPLWVWLTGVALVLLAVLATGRSFEATHPPPTSSLGSPAGPGSRYPCACRLPEPPEMPTLPVMTVLESAGEQAARGVAVVAEHERAGALWRDGLARSLALCPLKDRQRMLGELAARRCRKAQHIRNEWRLADEAHQRQEALMAANDLDAGATRPSLDLANYFFDEFRGPFDELVARALPDARPGVTCDLEAPGATSSADLKSCEEFSAWDRGLRHEVVYEMTPGLGPHFSREKFARQHTLDVEALATYLDGSELKRRVLRDHARWLCALSAQRPGYENPELSELYANEARFFDRELRRLDASAPISSCTAAADGG